MLLSDRMVYSVKLWIIEYYRQFSKRNSDIQVSTVVEGEVKERGSGDNARRCLKQDGDDREKRGQRHLLQPEMPSPGDERHGLRAVVQRMHRPQRRDAVLRPVHPVGEDVVGENEKEKRQRKPPAVGAQPDEPAARRIDDQRRAGTCHGRHQEVGKDIEGDELVVEDRLAARVTPLNRKGPFSAQQQRDNPADQQGGAGKSDDGCGRDQAKSLRTSPRCDRQPIADRVRSQSKHSSNAARGGSSAPTGTPKERLRETAVHSSAVIPSLTNSRQDR